MKNERRSVSDEAVELNDDVLSDVVGGVFLPTPEDHYDPSVCGQEVMGLFGKPVPVINSNCSSCTYFNGHAQGGGDPYCSKLGAYLSPDPTPITGPGRTTPDFGSCLPNV